MAEPYDTINQYILDDTKRPDMQDEINRRISRALTYYHRKDNWKRDFIEKKYTLPAQSAEDIATNVYKIDLTDAVSFPRKPRQLCYIRKTHWPISGNDSTAVDSGDFSERSPDRLFDGYGSDLQDIFYRAGDTIILKPSTALTTVYLGFYADPTLPANITTLTAGISWIADNYQSLIAARVRKQVFKITGKNEESKDAERDEQDEFIVLAGNNIRAAIA